MSWEKLFRWLVVVIIALFTRFQDVFAQDDVTHYVVTANQVINARQCPRLDCAIVASLEPGTEIDVVAVVSGDTAFGSDQWLEVDDEGVQMFVHSALAEPAPDQTVEQAETLENSVDTSDWVTHRQGRLQVSAPRGWLEIGELAADDEYLADLEEMYGKEAREWVVNMNQACENGEYDLVLTEFDGSGLVLINHESRPGVNITPRYVKRLLEMSYTSSNDAVEVMSAEVMSLPTGEAARVQIRVQPEDASSGYERGGIAYGIIIGDEVHYMWASFNNDYVDQYTPLLDTLAASLDFDRSDL